MDNLPIDLVSQLRIHGKDTAWIRDLLMQQAAAEIERLKREDEVHWKTRRSLLAEIERLRRGEFICSRCCLRKPAEGEVECEF